MEHRYLFMMINFNEKNLKKVKIFKFTNLYLAKNSCLTLIMLHY